MQVLSFQFQSLAQLSLSFRSQGGRSKDVVRKGLRGSYPSIIVRRLPRRLLLQFIGLNHLLSCNSPLFAAPIPPDMKEPDIVRTLKLPSGVRIQEIVEGDGPEAHEGDSVEVNYVCRRSNGYFVHSTVDQFSGESSPIILPLDENQIIRGLKEVLIGMRVGGKRRALIPPSVGYTNENLKPIPEERLIYSDQRKAEFTSLVKLNNFVPLMVSSQFGPRRSLLSHANEPLVFEVQLLKII